ncbi:hypothetical protein [Streptomyces fagopyri]|uniref:hypothetical protein n=1 Tax=Streptomyces fagopyri TaxID=2662397 RepID=UPI003713A6E4
MKTAELGLPSALFGVFAPVVGRSGAVPWSLYGVAVADRVDGSAGAYRTTGVGDATAVGSVGVPGEVRRWTTGLSLRPAGPAAATGRPPEDGACGAETRAVER